MIEFCLFVLLVGVVGGIWLLCGLGPYVWVRSAVPQRGLSGVGLGAGLGLALLGGTATQVFYLEIAPLWTVVLAAAISLGLVAAAGRSRRGTAREALAGLRQRVREDLDFGIGGMILAAIVFLPGYGNSFGQPYRVGIDQVGYAVTAQYLRDGGTPSALRREIVRQTGQPGETQALNAHLTALSFNLSVASEFLLKAHRLGYPVYLAGIGQLLGREAVIDYQFCLLAVPWFVALLLLLWFFRDVLRLPDLVARAMAAGVAMNPNQLNVLFEGQHAQVMAFPLLVLFFGGMYCHRSAPVATPGLGVIVALAGIGIFSLYSDAYIALGVIGGALWLADLGARDWPALRRTTVFGLSVALGVALLNRYTMEWVGFIQRHLANLGGGNGGWPQPHWASPAEIAGYFSMYRGALGNLLPRPDVRVWLEAAATIAIVVAVAEGGRRAWRDARVMRYWAVPALVLAWVYVDLRWLKGFHNYGFMKFYTLLLVPLSALHWTSLHAYVRHRGGVWGLPVAWCDRMVAGIAAIVIAMGTMEAAHFMRSSTSLSPEAGRVLQRLHRERDLSGYVILTYPGGGIGPATMAAYSPFNWLNVAWSDKFLAMHQDKPVVIVVYDLPQFLFSRVIRGADLLYRGDEFAVILTDRRLADLGLPEIRTSPDGTPVRPLAQLPLLEGFLYDQLHRKPVGRAP